MILTEDHLIQCVDKSTDMSKVQLGRLLENLFEILKNNLANGEGLSSPDSGNFALKRRKNRGEEILKQDPERVGDTESEAESLRKGSHRVRLAKILSQAPSKYLVLAEVVSVKHCNSMYSIGRPYALDVDGNFITKLTRKENVCTLDYGTLHLSCIQKRPEPSNFVELYFHAVKVGVGRELELPFFRIL